VDGREDNDGEPDRECHNDLRLLLQRHVKVPCQGDRQGADKYVGGNVGDGYSKPSVNLVMLAYSLLNGCYVCLPVSGIL
jgi:hypothetical protein